MKVIVLRALGFKPTLSIEEEMEITMRRLMRYKGGYICVFGYEFVYCEAVYLGEASVGSCGYELL